jgi:hypothetical protein
MASPSSRIPSEDKRDNCVSQFPTIPCYVTQRRFPAPWTAEEYRGISYIIRDANNFPVAYIYFDTQSGPRSATNMMTKDEARGIAAGIAEMPELLGKLQRAESSGASRTITSASGSEPSTPPSR